MPSDFTRRFITAILIGVVIIGATLLGSLPSAILVALLSAMCCYEMFSIAFPRTATSDTVAFVIVALAPIGVALYELLTFNDPYALFNLVYLPVSFIVYAVYSAMRHPKDISKHIATMAWALMLFTAGGIFGIEIANENPRMLLYVFVLLWGSDVFAYLVGSRIGKRKMAPAISPGKSWEGALGGLLSALALGGILFHYDNNDMDLTQWLTTAALVVVFGIAGDLLQSGFKRTYGVKDSGTTLPGHGGFWDRFDSFFGCISLVAIYIL